MRASLTFVLSLLVLPLCAQVPAGIPRDTSFNIAATLLKEQKKRPLIRVADPQSADSVRVAFARVYDRVGNRELKADIFYPAATKKARPAVLLIFGGGWRSGDRTHNYAMCKALANAGFVAVTADYRLSMEARYPAAVADLEAVLRWMRRNAKRYGIDPARIATLGCSAGGQLATLVGLTAGNTAFGPDPESKKINSTVQAIINIDGTLAFRHPESAEGKAASDWLGGNYDSAKANWESAAPLNHVTTSAPPILFLNSSIPRFHAGRDDMIRKLDSLGIYSEVHTFGDTPHPFWFFHPWFDPMMSHIITFLHRQFG